MKPQAAEVLVNGRLAGVLRKTGQQYTFRYDATYLQSNRPAISLTLPKRPEVFVSPVLFSFFYGLLAEGVAKQIQCQELRLAENDHFTRLLRTAHTETIGAVTVREIQLAP